MFINIGTLWKQQGCLSVVLSLLYFPRHPLVTHAETVMELPIGYLPLDQ